MNDDVELLLYFLSFQDNGVCNRSEIDDETESTEHTAWAAVGVDN